jgi:protocatechuate 3,4-dioxygenase beta subunit
MTKQQSVTSILMAVMATAVFAAQSHVAPANAPASARMTPANEPGRAMEVSGVVVSETGAPIAGASIYAFQTDFEGYYSVKPASDNQNPRLKTYLRTGARGEWSFDTIWPGSYPNSRVPGHIHFEVNAPGFKTKVFEIVFEGDPFITAEMRSNAAFSVRPVTRGTPNRVTERITLTH